MAAPVTSATLSVPNADIILCSRRASDEAAETTSVSYYRLQRSKLAAWSDVFADMLDLGTSSTSDQEGMDGLPLVRLDESAEVLNMLLPFMTGDISLFPDLEGVALTNLLAVWLASLKFEIIIAQAVLEPLLLHAFESATLREVGIMYAEALARKRVRLAKKCHERFLANSHSKWPTELKDQIGLQAYHTLFFDYHTEQIKELKALAPDIWNLRNQAANVSGQSKISQIYNTFNRIIE